MNLFFVTSRTITFLFRGHIFWKLWGRVGAELDERTIRALIDGIEESEAQSAAALSSALDSALPPIGEWRSNRKYNIHKDYLNNKRLLLDQLITLRTQQLYEQEKNLLQRLQRLYPGDSDIRHEVEEHRQRHALEILQRRSLNPLP